MCALGTIDAYTVYRIFVYVHVRHDMRWCGVIAVYIHCIAYMWRVLDIYVTVICIRRYCRTHTVEHFSVVPVGHNIYTHIHIHI